MTVLSAWLATLEPGSFYPDRIFHELRQFGILYDEEAGVLTSHIVVGNPYPSYGRMTSVPRMTERQLIVACYKLGIQPVIEKHGEIYVVFGFGIINAVWQLIRPITVALSPSDIQKMPDGKARADLAAIRRYGL